MLVVLSVTAASGTVTNDYTTANVVATSTGNNVGGFVGASTETINKAYSSGSITVAGSEASIGGFSGQNSGTISNIYWNDIGTGLAFTSSVGSGTAATSATAITSSSQALAQGTYTNFTFGTSPGTGTWYSVSGTTLPTLQMEYSTVVENSHQLQMVNENLGAVFTQNG